MFFKINFKILLHLLLIANFRINCQTNSTDNSDYRTVTRLNVTEELNAAIASAASDFKEWCYERARQNNSLTRFKRNILTFPNSFSLLDRNVLMPIEKQGVCGSCYAFTTVSF